MGEEIKYCCAECGATVIRVDDALTRTCPHENAAVTADLEAVAYGVSHFN